MLLTGVLGWPIGHSRSPAMHNAAFAAAGVAGVYVPLAVKPSALSPALAGLVALGFRGCNVTIPHKQAVIPHLHYLTDTARAIGAVNTIIIDAEKMLGDNTDAAGFWADLQAQEMAPPSLQQEGALILGAGGAARAIAYALANHGIPITVLARRPQQGEALLTALHPYLPPDVSTACAPWSALAQMAAHHQLIVNCTPVGMYPHPSTSPWPEHLAFLPRQMVYDLVYNPQTTQLMRQARAHGARVSNGLDMLVHQGALAWSLWSGQPAPVQVMRTALR